MQKKIIMNFNFQLISECKKKTTMEEVSEKWKRENKKKYSQVRLGK